MPWSDCWIDSASLLMCNGKEERVTVGSRMGSPSVVNTADVTMTEIKSSVLEEMTPGEAVDPWTLIKRIQDATGISSYDLKAAIWYLIGDRSVRLDEGLNVVRIEQASGN